jgi:hypothetical protein
MRIRVIIGGLAVMVLAGLAWWYYDSSQITQITTGAVITKRAGEQLAFLFEHDLYVLDLQTGETTQLTRHGKIAVMFTSVQWLPGGNDISFLDRDHHLYTLNVVTGDLKRIRDHVLEYRWSPNGTQLVWVEENKDLDKLFVSNADGSDRQEIRSMVVIPILPGRQMERV